MSEAVEMLDALANHFAFHDWDYTRKHHIKHIRYTREYDSYDTFGRRLKSAWEWLVWGKKHGWLYGNRSLLTRIELAWYSIRREDHLPDGVLDGGSIITHWEETGEYLQLVQPTVGALLATFLKEDPTNPHAQLITAELERLHARYAERVAHKEVDRDHD